jgi:PhzF family phenazine biosynthesis protein
VINKKCGSDLLTLHLQGGASMQIYQVAAFTEEPFHGNPAVVCFLSEPKNDGWMQSVATEMNMPVTAFLYKNDDHYSLRWFTSTTEIPICGHGTLASAHILYDLNHISREASATFMTKSGWLTANFNAGWIEFTFPSKPDQKTIAPKKLNQALGVKPTYVGKNHFDYIVEVEGEDVVKNLKPNIDIIAQMPVRGVIVTSVSNSNKYDFVSRFFSPAQGIDEDAVTGSAHCCLGPYWERKLNKSDFIAFQASSRGGILKIRVNGERVLLAGKAMTVLEGKLRV